MNNCSNCNATLEHGPFCTECGTDSLQLPGGKFGGLVAGVAIAVGVTTVVTAIPEVRAKIDEAVEWLRALAPVMANRRMRQIRDVELPPEETALPPLERDIFESGYEAGLRTKRPHHIFEGESGFLQPLE